MGNQLRHLQRIRSGFKALHIVNVWSCANGISLGQLMVDEKTNEITAIPDILKKLCIEGAIVTLDAMNCQKAIAEQIVEQKGDYILRVKANQGRLHDAMETTFKQGENLKYQAMRATTALMANFISNRRAI